jgi:hypothetical protein
MNIETPKKLNTECFESEELKVNNQMIETSKTDDEELTGIGGWLILVGIGRVIALPATLWIIFHTYVPQLTSGALDKLSQPGNVAYSTLWKPIILFEFYNNIVLVIFEVVLLFLFFKKKKWFPKVCISMLIFSIVFTIIDAALVSKLQSSISISLNINPLTQVTKVIVSSAVWIPYFLTSKRVKNTFIR